MSDQPDLPSELEQPEAVSLAADVLNCKPIDWGEASSAVGAEYAAEYRVLAALAAVHRTGRSPILGDRSPEGAGDEPTLGTWGPLTLLERIGEGAFGQVYRAWDPALHQEVALKLLRPTATGEADGSATVEEGRLLARIHHENVIRVFGAQRIGPEVGLWTEFIHGRTLAAVVRDEGPLSAEEAIATGIAICRALTAAHQVGVLHRDVKAQNVMREEGGRIVLLDFGAGRDWRTTLGSGPDVAGTPWYLAPEVLAGQPPTPKADLYSLGVLLFFLVTGDFPVKGASVKDLRAKDHGEASAKLRAARPDLPPAFIALVDRALRPSPAQRFESAAVFAAALGRARGRHYVRPVTALIGACIAGAVITALVLRQSPAGPASSIVATRLTVASAQRPLIAAAAISPNGQFLAYVDSTGLRIQSPAEGEPRPAMVLGFTVNNLAWLPDSVGILISGSTGVWRTSVLGDPLRQVSRLAGPVSVSRAGRVAVTTETEIHILGADFLDHGTVAEAEAGTTFTGSSWSPDGQRMAYGVFYPKNAGKPTLRTIETRRVDGSDRAEVYRGPSLFSFVWAPDNRILFARAPVPANGPYGELWQVRVNARTGRPIGPPAPLWQPPELTFRSPSITTDGRDLVFSSSRAASEIDLADFDPEHMTLGALHQTANSDTSLALQAWTIAGDALVVAETHPSGIGPFKRQPLRGGEAKIVVPQIRPWVGNAALTADGRWMIYAEIGAMPSRGSTSRGYVMRVAAAGGPETPLFAVSTYFNSVKCAPHASRVCVIGLGAPEKTELAVFDPAVGKPTPFASIPRKDPDPNGTFDLSADGTEVVTVGDASILVINVASGQARAIRCTACGKVVSVLWIPNHPGWLVTTLTPTGATLWQVDLQGDAKLLWQSAYQRMLFPLLSPDGRRLAGNVSTTEASVWSLRGF